MKYEDCKKCPKEICKPNALDIFNDNEYCAVPPCSSVFKEVSGGVYFLAGRINTPASIAAKLNNFGESVRYLLNECDISLEGALYLTKLSPESYSS